MQPPISKRQENRPPEAANLQLCNRDSLLQDLYRMTDFICTCSNKDNSPFAPMTDSSSDMEYVEPCEPFHISVARKFSFDHINFYCLTLDAFLSFNTRSLFL